METTMASEIKVRTNNAKRPLLSGWELTAAERKDMDYVAAADNEEAWSNEVDRFFRYRGQVYDTHEFSRVIAQGATRCHPMECAEPAFQGWDGYMSDSYFSGILIRYPHDECGDIDHESVVVALYTS